MKTTAAQTRPPGDAATGLLDLRSFIVLGLSLAVALAAAATAGLYAAHQAGSDKILVGLLAGFVAFAGTGLATATGLNSIIKPS